MANHKSAEKRARQTVKRNELNRSRRSAIRTAVKQADTAAAEGNGEDALKASRKAESVLARAASRGTLHKKTASRKTSRLAKRAKAAKANVAAAPVKATAAKTAKPKAAKKA